MTEENKKYNFKIKSSSEQKADPSKYKDFDKVYSKYTHWIYRNPWSRFQFHKSKNRKISLFIMIILLVGALLAIEYLSELNQ